MGISERANGEMQGFLKVHTSGTASALVRGNKSGVALESWRLLYAQYNPQTLSSTMTAQHLESHPKGASKIADLPACLLAWEKNLQRGLKEGRTPPSDDTKRLALLRMLPKQQREKVWDVANKLYPTFADLMAKVQEMIRDDADSRQGMSPMELDNIDDDQEGAWEATGQTFSGKGPSGEEMLFMLQKRGSQFRVKPKGGGKGGRAGGGKAGASQRKDPITGKPTKWDPSGCARCGRSNHWACECTAKVDIDGNPPKENQPTE